MGEAINLVNNFKVEKVIFNCVPYNDLEKELIKLLDKKNIKIKYLKILNILMMKEMNTGQLENYKKCWNIHNGEGLKTSNKSLKELHKKQETNNK